MILSCAAGLAACSGGGAEGGDDFSSTFTDGSEGSAETGDVSSGESGDASSGESGETGTPTCSEPCTDGECIDGVCCALADICDGVCCSGGQVCSFQACVTPGNDCLDDGECGAGEYCDTSLGADPQPPACMGGVILDSGKCVPSPPECPAGVEPEGDDVDCLPQCEVIPDASFTPEVKYHWDDHNLMMAPMVVQLDDDNCDGHVDENDVPEILITTFAGSTYQNTGTLRALTVANGLLVESWDFPSASDPIRPSVSIAGGNFHPSFGNEVVACTDGNTLVAVSSAGQELWRSPDLTSCSMPSIADFDQDGQAEILTERYILNGDDGLIKAPLGAAQTNTTAADIDGDGVLEVVGTHSIMEADGTVIATNPVPMAHVAVGDLDADGIPEIVGIVKNATYAHHLRVWRYNPTAVDGFEIVREAIDINGTLDPDLCPTGSAGNTGGGGPPTIADFDGDGFPDVGVAGGVGYAVFSGARLADPLAYNDAATELWTSRTRDCSSANTGSSVFDFDGNGSAEVVYSDENYLRIYRGTDGEVLFETCNTTGTLSEYPVIADVDADGHADIVAMANDYSGIVCPFDDSKQRGIRVFGDELGKWVRTRRVWNQHNYHVTNIEEDGTIPPVESPNWSEPGLNNFRQNVQPAGQFAAPDLVVRVLPMCSPTEYGAIARVRNLGRAPVAPGIPVGFYDGDPQGGGILLGTLLTTKTLEPAQSEDLVLPLDFSDADFVNGSKPVWVVVDDGMPPHPWTECRIDNNDNQGIVPCAPIG